MQHRSTRLAGGKFPDLVCFHVLDTLAHPARKLTTQTVCHNLCGTRTEEWAQPPHGMPHSPVSRSMIDMTLIVWIGFVALILILLALDLGVFHRRDHVISIQESLAWTAIWVTLSLAFNLFIYFAYESHWLGIGTVIGHPLGGRRAAIEFLTGYIIEKSLSLDNIFVIALIFAYFQIPARFQHRVLFWGILGALVMRGLFIAIGAALLQRFDWVTVVLGGLLIVTAVRMLLTDHDKIDPGRNVFIRITRKLFPVSDNLDGHHFLTRLDGRLAVTPMLITLLVVESSDVMFAIDSIPAIFAVTRDPFLVFTSNVFAILGLRSLYFALAGMIEKFHYLKISLSVILVFVGVKMLLEDFYEIETKVSLGIIAGTLGVGIVASIAHATRQLAHTASQIAEGLEIIALQAWTQAKRVIIIVIGVTLVLVGLAMVVLPGPAVVVIPLGLAILGMEFVWARRLLQYIKKKFGEAAGAAGIDLPFVDKKAD